MINNYAVSLSNKLVMLLLFFFNVFIFIYLNKLSYCFFEIATMQSNLINNWDIKNAHLKSKQYISNLLKEKICFFRWNVYLVSIRGLLRTSQGSLNTRFPVQCPFFGGGRGEGNVMESTFSLLYSLFSSVVMKDLGKNLKKKEREIKVKHQSFQFEKKKNNLKYIILSDAVSLFIV